MKTKIFSDEEFDRFAAKVEELIEKLGLHDWHVTVSHEQIGDRVAAQTQCNHVAKHASIRLTKQSEGDFGIEWNPERLATHEVLHLLLWDFCETACKLGDVSHPLLVAQEHAVLHRLMRAMP